jgi:hypothetical protein
MAFHRLHPFGEKRMDGRFAMLAALVANLWTDSKQTKRWTPEDFMPDYEKVVEEAEDTEDAQPVTVVDKVKAFFGMLAQANKQNAEGSKQNHPSPPQIKERFGEE